MSKRNLYQNNAFFQLVIGGIIHRINEPLNWDSITLALPRDKTSLAFSFEFVEDSIQLGFMDDDIAYSLIKEVKESLGSDGMILFQFGIIPKGTFVEKIQMEGNVNLNTYVDEKGTITCSVEKIAFENLLKTRIDTPISLNAFETLDGNPTVPAVSHEILLHSKKISKAFKAEVVDPKDLQSQNLARYMYMQIDTSEVVTSEVEENQSLPLGFSGVDPRDELRYFFKIKEDGDYTLKVKCKFILQIVYPYAQGIGTYTVVPRFMVQRGGATIENINFDQFRQQGSTSEITRTLTFDFSFELARTWQIDDFIYIDLYGLMERSGSTYIYHVSDYTSTVEVLGQTTAEETSAKSYRLFDAIEKMIEIATGQPNSLISSVLGPGGALYKTFITNGYAIRNFLTSEKPVISTIMDFLESIPRISGLGYGYKKVNGKDFFIIEKISYFFNNRTIVKLKVISDFRVEHAKEFVFNELEVGYERYSEDELNSLDEFNTYQTALTPIKTYKSKFVKKSKWITSGYSIEAQRREQFKTNPSQSLSNDDDIFIVSCNESFTRTATNYTTYPTLNRIEFSRQMNLLVGNNFKVIGNNSSSNNGKTFVVTSKVQNSFELYEVSGATLSSDNGSVMIEQAITEIQSEKDEAFTVVTGLFSPETAYNLRFSPKRILYNWSGFLNIGFDKKLDTDVIKTTFIKNNDKMTSMLSLLDPFRGYEPTQVIEEGGETALQLLRSGKSAFHEPTFYYFNARMDYDTFNYIKLHLTGEMGGPNDYGCIQFKNPDGIFEKGHVYSLKYDPAKEIANFQVAKIGNY